MAVDDLLRARLNHYIEENEKAWGTVSALRRRIDFWRRAAGSWKDEVRARDALIERLTGILRENYIDYEERLRSDDPTT